jgi:tryptophanyl-tRNA synthetase
MKVVSKPETVAFFDEQFNTMKIRYGDLKKQLAEDMVTFTFPLREKIIDLSKNNDFINKVVKQGAEKARESAQKTVREVRELIGFKHFG